MDQPSTPIQWRSLSSPNSNARLRLLQYNTLDGFCGVISLERIPII